MSKILRASEARKKTDEVVAANKHFELGIKRSRYVTRIMNEVEEAIKQGVYQLKVSYVEKDLEVAVTVELMQYKYVVERADGVLTIKW